MLNPEVITYRSGIVEHSKDCYRSWGIPYVVTRVAVNNGPGMVRFVMVGLPMEISCDVKWNELNRFEPKR